MKEIFVDQREIEKLGGVAVKYPVSFLLSKIFRELQAKRILDVTYGRGRFYKVYRPKLLVGCDPVIWEWVVNPDIFIRRPVWGVYDVLKKINYFNFDIIVVDPPFGQRGSKRPEYFTEHALGGPDFIISCAFELATRIKTPYVLLHYKKRTRVPNWDIVKTIKFQYFARYLKNPETNNTYFILYENKKT